MPTPPEVRFDYDGYLVLGSLPKHPKCGFFVAHVGDTHIDRANLRTLQGMYHKPLHTVKTEPEGVRVQRHRLKGPRSIHTLMSIYDIEIPRFTQSPTK
jgi:hypothetical protein